jgi:hypothetical protein
VIEKVVKIVQMRQSSSDCAYWRSRPVREGIDALEALRQQYIEHAYPVGSGILYG